METRLKPVPAFYCCYLLRSTIRHSSLYVGSTPHPTRRLAQHNGRSKGGAVRTSRATLRPWEMVLVVAGFPSNIAALQFEWAWHNAHLTRHILPEDRISAPVTKIRTNAKTGKTRKKISRPRTSLIDKLSNLHLLLRAPYFSKWPLELRFFNQTVHRSWLSWSDRVDDQIRPDIPILLDVAQPVEQEDEISSAQRPTKKRKIDLIGKGGIEGIDPTYARFQTVLQKLKQRTDDKTDSLVCEICEVPVRAEKDLFNICLDHDCTSVTHLSCLSTKFLQESDSATIVPKAGKCPSCRTILQWSDLMRVLSLRLRGEKEVKKLLKKSNRGAVAIAAELLEEEDEDSAAGSEDEGDDASMVDEPEDNVPHDSDSELDDAVSLASGPSVRSPIKNLKSKIKKGTQIEIVIGDSEDER